MANYNNDFSGFPIASGVPTGFTARWVTANVTHSIVDSTGDDDNKSFRQNRSATGRGLVTIDSVDGDANRADAEVLVRIRSVNPTAAQAQGGPALRCSGAAATETGYVCYPISNRLRIARYRGGISDPPLAESASTLGLTDDTWYWVRFRANGTGATVTLSAKIWAGAIGDEPGTPSTGWTVTHSDTVTPITAAGWCGMFAFGASNYDTDAIAVGTNGDTASFGGGGGDASATGGISAVTLVAPNGFATGSGVAEGSGSIAPVSIVAPNGSATGTTTLTIGPLKNNTGTLLASETGITVHIYQTSGALLVTKPAQTTNASGMLTVADALMVPGTTYRYIIVMASGAEGLGKGTV